MQTLAMILDGQESAAQPLGNLLVRRTAQQGFFGGRPELAPGWIPQAQRPSAKTNRTGRMPGAARDFLVGNLTQQSDLLRLPQPVLGVGFENAELAAA
jgi:hypothetical protein